MKLVAFISHFGTQKTVGTPIGNWRMGTSLQPFETQVRGIRRRKAVEGWKWVSQ
jgi:hypothetical protein